MKIVSTAIYSDNPDEPPGYDADNNVLSRQTRQGDVISFAYDSLNRLCSKTYAASPVACGGASANYLVTYTYDLDNRLIAANDNSVAVTLPGSAAQYAAAATYDQLDRPTNVSWSPAPAQATPAAASVSFDHQYDATNRRVGQTATDSSWWRYPGTGGSSSTGYTANGLNQYTAVGAASPTYDGNGNLSSDGTFSYCYDVESRLTAILSAGTCAVPVTTVATYAYDAQGRRKAKTVGSATTLYVTDADDREVLEYDGSSGAIGAWYSFAPSAAMGPDAVLNRMNVSAGSRQTLIPDIQGSIIGSLDSGGTLSKVGYEVYGENATLIANGYFYTGRRLDPETTGSASQPSGFYHLRARAYSPAWGRFFQTDPIGYQGGNNLYAYVGNDPLNLTDPSGNCVPFCTIAAGAVIGAVVGGTHAYLEGGNAWAILAGAGTGAIVGGTIASGIPIGAASLIVGTSASTTTLAAATYGTTALIGVGGGALVDAAAQGANIATGNQSQFNGRQFAYSTAEGVLAAGGSSAILKAGEVVTSAAGIDLTAATGLTSEIAAGQTEGAAAVGGAIVSHAADGK